MSAGDGEKMMHPDTGAAMGKETAPDQAAVRIRVRDLRKGFDDLEPENCAKYYKIEDLLWDAECAARDDREQQREMEMTEPDDWYDM